MQHQPPSNFYLSAPSKRGYRISDLNTRFPFLQPNEVNDIQGDKQQGTCQRNRLRLLLLIVLISLNGWILSMIERIGCISSATQVLRYTNDTKNVHGSSRLDATASASFNHITNTTVSSSNETIGMTMSNSSTLTIRVEANETMPSPFVANVTSTESELMKSLLDHRPTAASFATTSASNNTQHIVNNVSHASTSNHASQESSKNPFQSCHGLNFTEPAVCGANKCFVHVNHEPGIGYLVARLGTKSLLTDLNAAYERAKRLEQKHHIRHLYVEPPTLIKLPKCVYDQLMNSKNYVRLSDPGKKFSYKGKQKVVLQKNALAPNPYAFLGFSQHKIKRSLSQLKTFVKDHVTNGTAFRNQLILERKRTIAVLHDEPCLASDFQVMLDGNGNFYHLDFDRCAEGNVKREYKRVMRLLRRVLDDAIDRAMSKR